MLLIEALSKKRVERLPREVDGPVRGDRMPPDQTHIRLPRHVQVEKIDNSVRGLVAPRELSLRDDRWPDPMVHQPYGLQVYVRLRLDPIERSQLAQGVLVCARLLSPEREDREPK